MLDAYTVRKAVPRILIAVIGINISIYLCVAALDITVIISRGLENLLVTPFVGDTGIQIDNKTFGGNPVLDGALTAIITVIIIKAVAIGPALIGSVFPLILIVLLIALAVLFTLIIRQALIIFLCIISPVAIALFVLPGTEKYFRKWFDLFIKTLMVYPIIAVLFAMSNVMAAILLGQAAGNASLNIFENTASIQHFQYFAQQAGDVSDTGQTIKLLAAIVVIYAPLVLIPFAFKMAGGAIAAVMNAAQGVTQRKRGELSDGRRKKLSEVRAERKAKLDAGSLYQDRGLGRVINTYGRRKAVGARNRFGFGRQGQSALAQAQGAQAGETLRSNPLLNELRNNDDANNVLALSGGTVGGARDAARQLFTDENGNYDQVRAENALSAAAAVGFSRQNAVAALQTSAQTKWRAVGAGRVDIVQDGINRLAAGNESEARSLAYGNAFFSRESGRSDLGGHYVDISAAQIADYSSRHGVDDRTARSELTTIDGMGRTEVHQMVRGHTSQVTQNLEVAQRLLQSSDAGEREMGALRLLEFQKSINYASGDNQRIINQQLQRAGVNFNQTRTVRTPIRDANGNDTGRFDQQDVPISIEEQLAGLANTGISSTELSRRARVYDREAAEGLHGPNAPGNRGQNPGGPPGGGTNP